MHGYVNLNDAVSIFLNFDVSKKQVDVISLLTLPYIRKSVAVFEDFATFQPSDVNYVHFTNGQVKIPLDTLRSTGRPYRRKFAKCLGAFTKWRKATISFVMSVRSYGTIRLPLDGFS